MIGVCAILDDDLGTLHETFAGYLVEKMFNMLIDLYFFRGLITFATIEYI